MNKIKLFENWAEELNVPEYLDPSIEYIEFGGETVYHPKFKKMVKSSNIHLMKMNTANLDINFKSFSDYDFWNPPKGSYDAIEIDQASSMYKLENCLGIPETNELLIKNYLHYIKLYKILLLYL